MSINLLESLKEHLSGDVVSNLASLIGESPTNTESALKTALPSFLGGLVSQSSDSSSIGKLFDLLTSGNHDGGLLSNLGALSRGGMETNQLLTQGGNLLPSLFGDKLSGLTDVIANAGGISKNSSSSLLNFIAPVALGLLGKTMKAENIGSAAGLAQFLTGQGGFLKNFLPAGLGSLFGLNIDGLGDKITSGFDKAVDSLGMDDATAFIRDKASEASDTFSHFGDKLEDMAEETLSSAKEMAEDFGDSASKFGSHVAEEGKEFAHSAGAMLDEAEESGSKFLPWLLILAALALLWGLLKSCSSQEPVEKVEAPKTPPTTSAPAEPVVATPPTPAPAPEPAKVEPAPAPEPAASTDYEKTLSTGYALKAAKDGFVSKLVTYVESADPINKDLWFTMDGIQFDTAKASIRAESAAQVEHIAEVLKAYPKVKIKIGGYTDNTGKAAANVKLSKNRADAVKNAIVAKDVTADRIDAEGYGSEHPVASNDTPEGRQQNRRIDVRVTEK